MRILSQAGVEIEPVDNGFATDLGRQLQRDVGAAARGVHPPDIEVGVEVGRAQLRREIESAVNAVQGQIEANIPLDADGLAFRQHVQAAVNEVERDLTATIPTEPAAAAEYLAKLRAQVADVSRLVTAQVRTEVEESGFLTRARSTLRGFRKDLGDTSRDVATFGEALASVGKIPVLVSAVGSIVSITGAIKPAIGVIGLLPGILAAAGAAGFTASAGLIGFDDALKAIGKGDAKKLAAAQKEMSASGKEFTTTLSQLKSKLDDVRRSVQQKLFTGLASETQSLATRYLPVLDVGMGKVATSLNGLARSAIAAVNTPFFQGVVAQVFDTTASSLAAFTPAVGALFTALGNVISVGLPFIQQFSTWAGEAATAKLAFYGTAEGATALHDRIQTALTVLGQLGRIGTNVLSGLSRVFDGGAASGQSLLDVIENLTRKFSEYTATAEGQKQINDLMQALADIVKSLAVILPIFAGALSTIAGVFASLPEPVQKFVAGLLVGSLIIGKLTKVFAPLLSLLGRVGPAVVSAAARWGLLGAAARTAATTTGASVGSILAKVGGSLLSGLGGIFSKIPGLFSRLGPLIARIVPSLLSGLATLAPRILVFILQAISAVGRFVPGIGFIIAGVATAVLAIVTHWEFFKTRTIQAFTETLDMIKAFPGQVGSFLSGLGSSIASTASGLWDGLTTTLGTAIDSVGTFFSGLPGRIGGFLAGVGSAVASGASAAWDFLTSTLSAAVSKVGTFLANLPVIVGTILGTLAGTVAGLAIGIWNFLFSYLPRVIGQIVAYLATLPATVGTFLVGLATSVAAGATAAWNWLITTLTTVVTSVIAFVTALPGQILAGLTALAAAVAAGATAAWNWLVTTAVTAITAVIAFVTALPGQIAALLAALASTIATGATTAFMWLVTQATQLGTQAVAFVASLPGRIGAALASLASTLLNTAKTAFTSFLNGVKSGAEAVYNFVKEIPGKIVSALGDLGSLLVDSGRKLLQGFANGIKSGVGAAVSAAKSAAGAVSGAFPQSPAKYGPFSGRGWTLYRGHALMEGFADGITDMRGMLANTISDVLGSASGQIDLGANVTPTTVAQLQRAIASTGPAPAAPAAAPSRGLTLNQTVNAAPGQTPQQIAAESARRLAFALSNGQSSLAVTA